MSDITDKINEAFADYNTPGVPASGAKKVDKAKAREIGPLIDMAMVGLGGDPQDAIDLIQPLVTAAEDAADAAAASETAAAASAALTVAQLKSVGAALYGIALNAAGGAVWDLKYWPTVLFQDAAATTPVTASGQLVGCFKSLVSDSGWDLIQPTSGERPTFVIEDGIPLIRCANGKGLYTRETHDITVPLWLLGALDNVLGTGGGAYPKMGLFSRNDGNHYFLPYSLASMGAFNDFGAPLYINTPLYSSPSGCVAVIDTVIRHQEADIRLNGGPQTALYSPKTVSMNAGDVIPTAIIGVNIGEQTGAGLAQGTANASGGTDFFGGLIAAIEPDLETRDRLVDYFRTQIEPEIRSTDTVILIDGDSTSDDVVEITNESGPEIFYRWASESTAGYLRNLNADATIYYRNYASRGPQWTGWRRMQIGSGDRRLFVSNASVPGSQPSYHLGDKFAEVVLAHPHVDEVIWNHGHNMAVNYAAVTGAAAQYLRAGEWADAMDAVRRAFPDAVHMAIRTHPNMEAGNESMEAVVEALDYVAGLYGDVELVDIYDHFDTAGRPAGWHNGDFVHLSVPTGVTEQLSVFAPAYENWARPAEVAPALLGRTATNLLTNGSFDLFDAAVPDSWTKVGAGTAARSTEQVDVELDDNYAVKVAQASGSTYIEQTLSAVAHRNTVVTLAVRQFIAEGGSSTTGSIVLNSDGTGAVGMGNSYYTPGPNPAGAWRWMYHTALVPADANTITVRLYAALDGAAEVYYGRAILVSGARPKDLR